MLREPVELWCSDCKKVVEVTPQVELMNIDGRTYEAGTYYECPEDSLHELQEIRKCPICGNEMGYYDEFCPDCYTEANQYLTEMRDKMGLTQSQLEDLVGNVLGW